MILIKPYLGCNLQCAYCYQRNMRKKSIFTSLDYDLDAVLSTVKKLHEEKADEPIVLHGGEPLSMPFEDVKRILYEVYKMQGHTSIVTNGSLINDDIIKLFKKYKTETTISIDGFYPQNKLRGYPNNEIKCRKYTAKLLETMDILVSESISVNTIILLHRENVAKDKLKKLGEFIIYLWKHGMKTGKLNLCRVDNHAPYELTPEELCNAWKYIARIMFVNPEISYSPINDFLSNLCSAEILNDCYMGMCDLFHTERASTILGDGSLTCCLSTNNVVSHFSRAEHASYERYMVLQKIPMNEGGCKGCKYWNLCFGGCPANGIQFDWREKDWQCKAFYKLYEFLEENIRSFEPVFNERFTLATDKNPVIIEDKPVHRIIKKKFNDDTYKETFINGIKQIEYPDHIEIIYSHP